jgi:hypothetical protein
VCEAEKNTAGLLYFWSPASKRANEAGPKKDSQRRVLCLLGWRSAHKKTFQGEKDGWKTVRDALTWCSQVWKVLLIWESMGIDIPFIRLLFPPPIVSASCFCLYRVSRTLARALFRSPEDRGGSWVWYRLDHEVLVIDPLLESRAQDFLSKYLPDSYNFCITFNTTISSPKRAQDDDRWPHHR